MYNELSLNPEQIESVKKTLKNVSQAYNDTTYGIALGQMYRSISSKSPRIEVSADWLKANQVELDKCIGVLGTLESNGRIRTSEKYDDSRKSFIGVSYEAVESAFACIDSILKDANYLADCAVIRTFVYQGAGIEQASLVSQDLATFYGHFKRFESSKSLFRYFSPGWWGAKLEINRRRQYAFSRLEKASAMAGIALNLVFRPKLKDEIVFLIKAGKEIYSDFPIYLLDLKNNYQKIKSFDFLAFIVIFKVPSYFHFLMV